MTPSSILVAGDSIVDVYVHGSVTRISPEAPVPVLVPSFIEKRPGGAANVAANVASLAGSCSLACVQDSTLFGVLPSSVDFYGPQGRVTKKTRYCAGPHHIMRLDEDEIVAEGLGFSSCTGDNVDVLVVSDYCKGFVRADDLRDTGLTRWGTTILDTKSNLTDWLGLFHVATPNELELQKTVGLWSSEEDLNDRVWRLLDSSPGPTNGNLLLTRSEKGCTLFTADRKRIDIPCVAQSVRDVTGAGDVLVATLAVCISHHNMDLVQASFVANAMAGLSVSKFGAAIMSKKDLYDCIDQRRI